VQHAYGAGQSHDQGGMGGGHASRSNQSSQVPFLVHIVVGKHLGYLREEEAQERRHKCAARSACSVIRHDRMINRYRHGTFVVVSYALHAPDAQSSSPELTHCEIRRGALLAGPL